MPMKRTWEGLSLEQKSNRATARALVGMGMQVVRETKIVTHRISGDLARSVHAAPMGYEGYEEDQAAVENGTDLMMMHAAEEPTPMPGGGWAIEVGSWLPYACVEWVGRGHPGLQEGLEAGRARADALMVQAFSEEGLL